MCKNKTSNCGNKPIQYKKLNRTSVFLNKANTKANPRECSVKFNSS